MKSKIIILGSILAVILLMLVPSISTVKINSVENQELEELNNIEMKLKVYHLSFGKVKIDFKNIGTSSKEVDATITQINMINADNNYSHHEIFNVPADNGVVKEFKVPIILYGFVQIWIEIYESDGTIYLSGGALSICGIIFFYTTHAIKL